MNYLKSNKQYKAKYLMQSNGFTLIELIITIAIAAIVLAIAVPSFSTIIEKNRISNEASRLFATLKQTRNNAIVTGTSSFLCRVAQADVANLACSANIDGVAIDWSGDFLIYTGLETTFIPDSSAAGFNFSALEIQDLEGNNANKDQMVQSILNAPNNGVKIYADTNQSVIEFSADGSVQNGALRFAVCDPRQDVPEENGRIIVVNEVGVVRSFNTDPDDASRNCMIP